MLHPFREQESQYNVSMASLVQYSSPLMMVPWVPPTLLNQSTTRILIDRNTQKCRFKPFLAQGQTLVLTV